MILIPYNNHQASYAISKLGVAYVLDALGEDHVESHYNAKDILFLERALRYRHYIQANLILQKETKWH